MAIFEIQGPDGSIYEVDAPDEQSAVNAFKTFTASTEAAAQPEQSWGEWLHGNIVGNPDDGITNGGEALGSWLNRAGESMTLGVVGDEAAAAADALIGRGSYDERLDQYRKQEEDLGTMGQLSADITGALLPIALSGGSAAPVAAGRFGKALKPVGDLIAKYSPTNLALRYMGAGKTLSGQIARGAALGTAAGAVTGFMEGEDDLANRAATGAVGAGIGGLVGGATPVVAEVAGNIYRAGADAFRAGRVGSEIGSKVGVSPSTGRVLDRVMGGENLDDALARLQTRPEAMLADQSEHLAGMLDTTLRTPAPGATAARARVDDRAAAELGNFDALANRMMGAPDGILSTQEGIRVATQGDRAAKYKQAYQQAIDWRSPDGEDLAHLLRTTPRNVYATARDNLGMRVKPFESGIPLSAYADELAPAPSPLQTWGQREQADIDAVMARYGQLNKEAGALLKRPFTYNIKQRGGIDPRSPLASELRARGITSKTTPGLFRNGGLRDLDNLPASEFPEAAARFDIDEATGYLDRNGVIASLEAELRGAPVHTSQGQAILDELDELDRLLPDVQARQAEVDHYNALPSAPPDIGEAVPLYTVEDIDHVKRTLDDIAANNRGTSYGIDAGDRAKRIRDTLIKAVPDYEAALIAGKDNIVRQKAVEVGADIVKPHVTREQARMAIEGMTKGEKEAAKIGLRSQIDDALARVKLVASDRNGDAREAQRLFGMLSDRATRDKMRLLFSDGEFSALEKQLDRLGDAVGLRSRLALGSPTQPRQAADALISEEIDPGALRSLKPIAGPREVAQKALGSDPASIARTRDLTKAELADILTRQGDDAQKVLQEVLRAQSLFPLNPKSGTQLQGILSAMGVTQSGRTGEKGATGLLQLFQ